MTLNPFRPGAGHTPPEFAGRQEPLNTFTNILRRTEIGAISRGMMLYGLRGMGKTVLLRRLQEDAKRAGWVTISLESGMGKNAYAQVRTRLGKELALAVRGYRQKSHWKKLLSNVASLSATLGFAGASVVLKADTHHSDTTGLLDFDLPETLLSMARELKDQTPSAGVGIFIDEIQDLDNEMLDILLTTQHEAGQKELPFYIFGAGLPSVPTKLGEIKTYAERLFSYHPLERLNDDQTRLAYADPIAKNGGSITQDALAELVDQSHGYPYFIQQFGRDAWDCASAGNITEDDVRVGVTLGWEELNRGFYMTRWNRATESEKHYLVAVADLMSEEEGDSVPVAEVSSRMKSITTSLSARRASLIEKGVLYSPAYGRIAFTVPGMDRFIKRSAQ